MAFLTIATVDVKVGAFARLTDERGGGGPRRTINGELRGRSDWVKESWGGTLIALDDTERDAVLAVIDPDAAVSVSGDAIGSSISAVVEITGEIAYVRTGADWYYEIPVSVRTA